MRQWIITSAILAIATPFAGAQFQQPKQTSGPFIPLNSPTVPSTYPNPFAPRLSVTPSLQMGYNNNLGTLPGSAVYVPPRYVGYPGSTYIINNYNNGTQNPFGVPSNGFQGGVSPYQTTYMMMGGTPGQTSTNPFVSNLPTLPQTWNNTTGVGPNGRPWAVPPGFGTGALNPQYPYMMNGPTIVGQANGFFPNQPAPIAQPANPNMFGVQRIPGLNAPPNP